MREVSDKQGGDNVYQEIPFPHLEEAIELVYMYIDLKRKPVSERGQV